MVCLLRGGKERVEYIRFHQRNRFAECETGSNKVKLPKVGSNAIVPVPVRAGPNKRQG